MKFTTKIPLKKQSNNQVDYNSNIILIGSCFSENISTKFSYFKFKNLVNPYGILFNPITIEKSIIEGINQFEYSEHDLYYFNDLWLSLHHHSKFSSDCLDEILTIINHEIELFHQSLKKASHIIITLGTAWVYRFIETDTIVANCHKIPQKKFLKELLTIKEITESLEATIALIKSINTKATILLTVSPVRHLKDGFIENQQSKAHLISAIHNVIDNRKQIHYFPSYEIMMDELRDYRFYNEDMIHPNQTAINYIWEKFINVWVSEDTQKTMLRVENIQKGLAHKPFNENTDTHKAFLKQLKEKQEKLNLQFPTITF